MTITAGTAHIINTGMALSSASALAKETRPGYQLFPDREASHPREIFTLQCNFEFRVAARADNQCPISYTWLMADYRAYVVGHDGHFVSFEGFACRDDGEAIAKAKRRRALERNASLSRLAKSLLVRKKAAPPLQ
jgi:hypothetical protein